MELLYKDLTNKIIRCFLNVFDELGRGFLESVYENAMMLELHDMGLEAQNQKELKVFYRGEVVGVFRSDIIVENKVLIEIKAARALVPAHDAQLVNYLKVTGIKVGLLLNFGEKPDFSRRIL